MGKTQIALLRLRPRAFKAQAGVMGGGGEMGVQR